MIFSNVFTRERMHRDQEGAVIHSAEDASAQAVALASNPRIHSICVHGDSPNAVHIANLISENNAYKEEFVKGEYYTYRGKERLENLIYPTPTENSLGLHATIDLGKGIRFGPSAYIVDEIDYNLSLAQKSSFLKAVQSYWPGIKEDDLSPGYTGIRPKLKGVSDFVVDSGIIGGNQYVNILGYASPGLTSSLALAIEVSQRVQDIN